MTMRTGVVEAPLIGVDGCVRERTRVLTFNLGTRETFALPVDCIAEIRTDTAPLTKAVGFTADVAGMFSWRGSIVLVHHLAMLLGLDTTPQGAVLLVDGGDQQSPYGLHLHSVGAVIDVAPEDFHPVPSGMATPKGVAGIILRGDGTLVTLLDIGQLAVR